MAHQPLAADSPVDAEDRQIEAWRGMSTVEKAARSPRPSRESRDPPST